MASRRRWSVGGHPASRGAIAAKGAASAAAFLVDLFAVPQLVCRAHALALGGVAVITLPSLAPVTVLHFTLHVGWATVSSPAPRAGAGWGASTGGLADYGRFGRAHLTSPGGPGSGPSACQFLSGYALLRHDPRVLPGDADRPPRQRRRGMAMALTMSESAGGGREGERLLLD